MAEASKKNASEGADVIIVGAGIAGSTFALALSGHGLRITLVEARALPATMPERMPGCGGYDLRVSALTPRSQALLQRLDVWPDVLAHRACPYTHMAVWDAEGTAEIHFDRSEVAAPALGTIVENGVLVAALAAGIQRAADIRVLAPHRVVEASCSDPAANDRTPVRLLLDDGSVLQAPLLVAADGALSPLRSLLGFATREWDYGHQAVVATIRTELPHAATARQRFLPTGPLALLPLPAALADPDAQVEQSGQHAQGEHYCSIVWSLEDAVTEQIMALDDAAFCTALTEASEHCLGEVLECSVRQAFALRQRHAVDYVQPGVALVADAAHTIHPLAGQGINLGLADVEALAQEVLLAVRRGLCIGSLPVLQRYQRQRKGANLGMMAGMDVFKRLFGERALPVRWLRNEGMRRVAGMPMLKRQLMRHAMGLSP